MENSFHFSSRFRKVKVQGMNFFIYPLKRTPQQHPLVSQLQGYLLMSSHLGNFWPWVSFASFVIVNDTFSVTIDAERSIVLSLIETDLGHELIQPMSGIFRPHLKKFRPNIFFGSNTPKTSSQWKFCPNMKF